MICVTLNWVQLICYCFKFTSYKITPDLENIAQNSSGGAGMPFSSSGIANPSSVAYRISSSFWAMSLSASLSANCPTITWRKGKIIRLNLRYKHLPPQYHAIFQNRNLFHVLSLQLLISSLQPRKELLFKIVLYSSKSFKRLGYQNLTWIKLFLLNIYPPPPSIDNNSEMGNIF